MSFFNHISPFLTPFGGEKPSLVNRKPMKLPNLQTPSNWWSTLSISFFPVRYPPACCETNKPLLTRFEFLSFSLFFISLRHFVNYLLHPTPEPDPTNSIPYRSPLRKFCFQFFFRSRILSFSILDRACRNWSEFSTFPYTVPLEVYSRYKWTNTKMGENSHWMGKSESREEI